MPQELTATGEQTNVETGEREHALSQIDKLINKCKGRLESVSPGILSDATKSATIEMYEKLRIEAEDGSLRSERLQWMEQNVDLLNKLIAKAAHEREFFEAELEKAVKDKLMSSEAYAKLMNAFEDPSLLEMKRSDWYKKEWPAMRKRLETLKRDRSAVLARAKRAKLSGKELPELHDLENIDQFLALPYAERRRKTDTASAAIDACSNKKTQLLRSTEAMLLAEASGEKPCMHRSKVGRWLQRMIQSENPEQFHDEILLPFIANWRKTRDRYDTLESQWNSLEKPVAVAFPREKEFLSKSYDDRLNTLSDLTSRLNAAERRKKGEETALDRHKGNIRNSIDLDDLTTAERQLDILREKHEDDPDVPTLLKIIASKRAGEREKKVELNDQEQIEASMESLNLLPYKVPAHVAKYYRYILEQDPEAAALFFGGMQARLRRRRAGQTSDAWEQKIDETSEEIEETTVVENATETDHDDEQHDALIITQDTEPQEMLRRLREQARLQRSDGLPTSLIFEGLSFGEQEQLEQPNRESFGHLRELEKRNVRFVDRKRFIRP